MKLPVVPGKSRSQIEYLSTMLLKHIQPDAFAGKEPIDIDSVYEFYLEDKYGIKTYYTDLSKLGTGILGYTDASSKKSFIDSSLSNSDNSVTIRRFRSTVGHEIGHCILHVNILNDFRSTCSKSEHGLLYRAEPSQIKPYMNPEWQAWEYAQSYLMPEHLVRKYTNQGVNFSKMVDLFDVNPKFLEVRLRKLKINSLSMLQHQ